MAVNVAFAASLHQFDQEVVTWCTEVRPDPFTVDVVAVPNLGVRRYLERLLATTWLEDGRGGICAAVEFWYPGRVGAPSPSQEVDPWSPAQLVWPVLAFNHERGTSEPRPYSRARRLADLLDRYELYRPEMVRRWLEAASEADLAPVERTQAILRRALDGRLEVASPSARRLEHLTDAGVELPGGRLLLVGLEVVTPSLLESLEVLGARHQVSVLSLCASTTATTAATADGGTGPANLLVGSWGALGLGGARSLGALGTTVVLDAPTRPHNLLGALQRAIDEDRPPARRAWSDRARADVLTRGDGSVVLHRCHGITRQLEVARDAILRALNELEDLTPAQVVVVAPELERFAATAEAVMGKDLGGYRLPVVVADRSLARPDPIVDALDFVLEVGSGRAEVDAVLALLCQPAVRAGLGLPHDVEQRVDELARVMGWRWGLDATHRRGQGDTVSGDVGTFTTIVDRLAASFAVAAPTGAAVLGDLGAFDGTGGDDLVVLDGLVVLLELLGSVAAATAGGADMARWCAIALDIVEVLGAPDDRQRVQVALLELEQAAAPAHGIALGSLDARAAIAEAVGSATSSVLLDSGSVTVTSLVALRGVPARVVVLLGMTDASFGAVGEEAEDLCRLEPQPSDRDPEGEQRLGLLRAVLSATDRLVVTCEGFDLSSGEPLPLPLILSELADAVAEVVPPEGFGSTPVVLEHTRQVANRANLDQGEGVAHQRRTFDPGAARLLGAAALGPKGPEDPQQRLEPGVVNLAELCRVLRSPHEEYLKRHQQAVLPRDREVLDHGVPLWPDKLERYTLGTTLLQAALGGEDLDHVVSAMARSGQVPPRQLGARYLDELREHAALTLEAIGPLGAPRVLEVDLELEGWRLQGTVPLRGEAVVAATYAKHHDARWLVPWLELCAAQLAEPQVHHRAILACQPATTPKGKVQTSVRTKVTTDDPAAGLLAALSIYARVLAAPVPYLPRYAWTIAQSPSAQDGAIERDLERSATALLVPARSRLELEADDAVVPIDEGLPSAAWRARRYALALLEGVAASTTEATDA